MPPAARSNRPGLLAVGSGEGAPLVAEQLALDQALGQRPAVDPDEGAGGARSSGGASAAATSSLPVPLSPTIRTGASVAAARPIALKTSTHRGALADQLGLVVADPS